MKTVAYIRVSGSKQDTESQKLALMKFAEKERFFIDEYIESVVSTKNQRQAKEFQAVLSSLGAGDRLVISELSRMGRTLGAYY